MGCKHMGGRRKKETSPGFHFLGCFVNVHMPACPPSLSYTPCPPPATPSSLFSTEPHSDEYYQYDVEACMRELGFQAVNTLESDPRHRVVLGHL